MSEFGNNPFPSVKRSIENLLEDEGGTIPAGKMLTIGTFMVVFGMVFATEAFAAHSSHRSHSSHSSHSSGSGGHSSHYSHVSHSSHSSGSHSSHSSHSSGSHSSHSNVGISPEDVVGIEKPEATPTVKIPHSDLVVKEPVAK